MVNWNTVETVLLDMDGTLLDLHFDNTFFLELVPQRYAALNGLTVDQARAVVLADYQEMQGTLAWYDLDYWTNKLGFDIPMLKLEVAHLIQVHPHVISFLEALAGAGLPAHLVTNAHASSLELKMARTPIGRHLVSTTTSHEIGLAKEAPGFWALLRKKIPFEPATTLLVDDSEPVLDSAAAFGMGQLLHMAAPSSQLPPRLSSRYKSATSFLQVMPVHRS